MGGTLPWLRSRVCLASGRVSPCLQVDRAWSGTLRAVAGRGFDRHYMLARTCNKQARKHACTHTLARRSAACSLARSPFLEVKHASRLLVRMLARTHTRTHCTTHMSRILAAGRWASTTTQRLAQVNFQDETSSDAGSKSLPTNRAALPSLPPPPLRIPRFYPCTHSFRHLFQSLFSWPVEDVGSTRRDTQIESTASSTGNCFISGFCLLSLTSRFFTDARPTPHTGSTSRMHTGLAFRRKLS